MSDNNEDIRIEYCEGSRRSIQQVLDACREERRPYVLIKKDLKEHSKLATILVPITMLEEEVYKAEICTYLARKTGAHIILLRANDYGSKAKRNTQRIITHIRTICERTGNKITYEEQVAKGDSFHIHKELASISYNLQEKDKGGILILLTASREYGLDDWLFGPPEQYVIRHSSVPVMLVNPRSDLFSLCD
ncbi:MAG: universal stress protein [Paludibacteraceae bacterium]|nr:universal stress protein [Paludibacteraceae bacterium]